MWCCGFDSPWEARIPHGSAWVQAPTLLLRQLPAGAHHRKQQVGPCHPQKPWLVFQAPGLRQVGNRPVAGGPLSLSLPLPCLPPPKQSKQGKFLVLFGQSKTVNGGFHNEECRDSAPSQVVTLSFLECDFSVLPPRWLPELQLSHSHSRQRDRERDKEGVQGTCPLSF